MNVKMSFGKNISTVSAARRRKKNDLAEQNSCGINDKFMNKEISIKLKKLKKSKRLNALYSYI